MEKYVCTGCNYRFYSENPKECPYCGNSEKIEKEKNAEELLKEVEEML